LIGRTLRSGDRLHNPITTDDNNNMIDRKCEIVAWNNLTIDAVRSIYYCYLLSIRMTIEMRRKVSKILYYNRAARELTIRCKSIGESKIIL